LKLGPVPPVAPVNPVLPVGPVPPVDPVGPVVVGGEPKPVWPEVPPHAGAIVPRNNTDAETARPEASVLFLMRFSIALCVRGEPSQGNCASLPLEY
jgi:hypothetical protein